jgi:serine protease Do
MENPTNKQRLMALVLLILFSTTFGFVGGYFGDRASDNDRQIQQIERQAATDESNLITQIAKDVGPSVVSVNVTSRGVQQSLFGSQPIQRESAGTGIIIDSNGTILTNRHVIPEGTTSVSVTLSDGTELPNVEVIGRTGSNESLDIAFLKVTDKKGKDLKAAKLGDSAKMEVGDKVIAIGNALGQFQNTVTSGIISGYGRNVEAGDETGTETLENLFQTDASINQGNSGGPLVNIYGEVIGVNTAVAGEAENIGFAIPINDVKGLVTSVLRDGKLERPYLGVRYVALNDDYAMQNNLDVKRGAYVTSGGSGQAVIPDSPAAKASLKEGDIIVKVNDTEINERTSLVSALGQYSVGDKVNLTVVRDGKEQAIEVTLGSAPTS